MTAYGPPPQHWSPPPPSPGKSRTEKLEIRVKLASAIVALLTAVVTALGVVAGVLAKRATTAGERADTSQQETRTLEQQVQDLRAENEALRQELSDQAAPAPATPGTPPESGTETPTVYREGAVTLIKGEQMDVDAKPDDPQWGMTRIGQGGFDVRFDGNYLLSSGGQMVTTTAAASYESCRTVQGYSKKKISLSILRQTPTVCVISGTGRQAVFAIKRVSAEQLEFQATAYGS